MMDFLLMPPIAFLIYLGLLAVLLGFGKLLARKAEVGQVESGAYASGEEAPTQAAATGYRMFSQYALFFAIFHLAALLLATSGAGVLALVFLVFLFVMLAVLLL